MIPGAGGSAGENGGEVSWLREAVSADRERNGEPDADPLHEAGDQPNKQDMQAFNAAKSIAWAVAKGIEKHGIPAKPFFVEAVEKALSGL